MWSKLRTEDMTIAVENKIGKPKKIATKKGLGNFDSVKLSHPSSLSHFCS